MLKKKLAIVLLTGLLLSLLTACGFHLRGQSSQSDSVNTLFNEIHIVTNNSAFKKVLLNEAALQNISINANSDWAVNIKSVERGSIRVSSSQSVSTDQFRLKLSITYQLSYKGTELTPQSITRQSIFQSDEDQALSKNYEREMTYNELSRQAAQSLLQQISTLNLNPPDCNCDETETSATRQ